ncbi:hypothetical protein [Endozoicomonas sp. SESOKO1]|nr:hypothetical protein [Endozoicomonas sp. SESOKO1]
MNDLKRSLITLRYLNLLHSCSGALRGYSVFAKKTRRMPGFKR